MGPHNPWFWVLLVLFWYHGFRHWKMMTRQKSKPAIWLMGSLVALLIVAGTEKIHPGVIAACLVALALMERVIPGTWRRFPFGSNRPNQNQAVGKKPDADDEFGAARLSTGYAEITASAVLLLGRPSVCADGGILHAFPFPLRCPRCNTDIREKDHVIKKLCVLNRHEVLEGFGEVTVKFPYCTSCQSSPFDVNEYVTLDIPDSGLCVVASCGSKEFFAALQQSVASAAATLTDINLASFMQEHAHPHIVRRFGVDNLVKHTRNELNTPLVQERW